MLEYLKFFWWMIAIIFHFLGVIAAIDVIMKGRTAQGSIAWAISLLFFPYLALPMYIIFGSRRFYGYVIARRSGDLKINHIAKNLLSKLEEKKFSCNDPDMNYKVVEELAQMPFTCCNDAELLINGEATFKSIFKEIETAEDYILIQFYTVLDDTLGRKLREKLIRKVQEGIRVYFLYDEIGSNQLPNSYLKESRKHGIKISHFKTTRGWTNRLRLNFRNHRKIVVIDGKKAYMGGLNVSNKYLGTHPKYGFWRDTHVLVEGPSVQCVQLSFIADWYWANHSVPELNWQPKASETGNKKMIILSSGPADDLETCGIFFVHAINSARHRLWIVTSYFVPDQQVISALQLAALRGVDVKIIIPQKSDLRITYLSSFSYLKEILRTGAKIYRYKKGYLHQKATLIDDEFAVLGTANLDNRSFRINFEINMLVTDKDFAAEVEKMMEDDLSNSFRVGVEDYEKRPFWFKIAVRIARLFAPLQ